MSSNLGKHFKFVHDWKLYKDESTCLSVCRKAAATVYGCSSYRMDCVAQVLKQDYYSLTLTHRRYTDDKIFNYTLNEAEDVFAKNVVNYG